jgi:glycosyltransferase involved in cell wall biosynthesis
MTRILWMSDTPCRPSGFGYVTCEICKRLAALGYEILVLGWWSGEATTYLGLQVKPCPVSPTGAASAIAKYVAEFRPHYLVTLGDIPWLSYLAADDIQNFLSASGTRWCLYYPVDGALPDGSLPKDWVRVLSKADLAVTMSEFGLAATARCGIGATLIPHGCDTELFRPPQSKEDAKRCFGYEGKFVVFSDVRNHRRKLIPRTLDIIRQLKIPRDRLVFHLHTAESGQEDAESYRYNLRADMELLGLSFVTGVHGYADPVGLSMADMASLYAAADVHILTSFGEGFGLPTLQAASSGVVPIAPANSASTELVGGHGFAIPCDSWARDEFGLVRKFINRRQAASVLQALFDDPDLLNTRSAAARTFALNFSWDIAVAGWDALLRAGGSSSVQAREVSSSSSLLPRRRLGCPKALALRPTGHDPSVLPIPRIAIPTRLRLQRKGASAGRDPIILAEASCVRRLSPLERLFPGTVVVELAHSSWRRSKDLQKLAAEATLVVDPKNRFPGLDRVCALLGINFLGDSPIWPSVESKALLGQARLLLTDHALSGQRASIARRRARDTPESVVKVLSRKQPRVDKVSETVRHF